MTTKQTIIQHKRGLKDALAAATLQAAEFAFTIDTKELFIGDGTGAGIQLATTVSVQEAIDAIPVIELAAVDKDGLLSAADKAVIDSIPTEIQEINANIVTAKTEAITESNGYTDTKIAALIDSAPGDLDTLKELGEAITSLKTEDVDGLMSALSDKVSTADFNTHVTDNTAALADLTADLTALIKQEAETRTSAVSDLQSGLAAETTARENADKAADGRITTLEGKATTLEGKVTALETQVKALEDVEVIDGGQF